MNLERLPETNLEKGLTHYGDSLTLFGEMVEVSHRQTPRKDCDAKAPRQDSTISELRLGIALPNDRAAASQGCEAVVSVYPVCAAEGRETVHRLPSGQCGPQDSGQWENAASTTVIGCPSQRRVRGFLSLALAAVPLSFLCHQFAHPFAAARASLTRRA